jgi:hypothetical protein
MIRIPLLTLAAVLVVSGCTGAPKASKKRPECVKAVSESGKTSGSCLPLAPRTKRVDLHKPRFGHAGQVTNPLHPTGTLTQTVYGGREGGKPFRSEVSLLPQTKTIIWNGQAISALTSQYFAFSDGRIVEVALDWYAQADDGSVWYLGEDVFNYENGALQDNEGSWVAGKQAPPAMIMPAHPRKGAVYRTENDPPKVFEEVTVTSTGKTVEGPSGSIAGAITVDELHLDGSHESKTFAPGYGEFSTGAPGGEEETAALALPTDVRSGSVPDELKTFAKTIRRATGAVTAGDWYAADTAADAVKRAWAEGQPSGVPLRVLRRQTDRDIAALTKAVGKHNEDRARGALLRISQDELDLRSLYQAVSKTDLARLKMWARQLITDAAAEDAADVSGDAEGLRWTLDRVLPTLGNAQASKVAKRLAKLRTAAQKKDLAAAATHAEKLLALL